MKPINVENKLPANNTYVLARYTGGNWHDKDHQSGCVWKVVKFVSGISKDDRRKMMVGISPNPLESGWCDQKDGLKHLVVKYIGLKTKVIIIKNPMYGKSLGLARYLAKK